MQSSIYFIMESTEYGNLGVSAFDVLFLVSFTTEK